MLHTLTSGLAAFWLSDRDMGLLTAFHCKKLRALAAGRACSKDQVDGQKVFRAFPNQQLYALMRVPSVWIELVVGRLKMVSDRPC